jgi:hydroxyquinol 1,2-dioxygenase
MRGLFGWLNGDKSKGGAPVTKQASSGGAAVVPANVQFTAPFKANVTDVKLEYTAETITDATLAQMSTTTDPRFKEIMAAGVKHLHAFAREVKLTPSEWIKGIDFLTRTGQKCTPSRQEVILLSDCLGLSTLINTMHDTTAMEEATHSSLLGPFFRENAPKFKAGEQISIKDSSDEVVLFGKVMDSKGKPVPHAAVSVWQTATDGRYDMQQDDDSMDCRGEFTTDANGDYFIRSVRPLFYSIPMDGPVGEMIRAQKRHGNRPAHVHFLITAAGYREMVTALYIANDPHIMDDVVFGAHGDLIAGIKKDQPGCPVPGVNSIKFNFALAVESEADKTSGRVGADPSKLGAAAHGH